MANQRSLGPAGQADAISVLTADHEEVRQMFVAYQDLVDSDADDEEKSELAAKICQSLAVHTTMEEEIFYPAARRALDGEELLDEAEVEHASAKELIAQIQGMQPSDRLFDAKVKVLGEYVNHHVAEEEDELFPQLEDSSIDLDALGEELLSRKQDLTAQAEAESDANA